MKRVEYEFCLPDLENAEFFAENLVNILDSAKIKVPKERIQIIKAYEENYEEPDKSAWLVFFIKIMKDALYMKKIPKENALTKFVFKIVKKLEESEWTKFFALCLKRFIQFLPLILTFVDGEGSEAIDDSISSLANEIPGESKDIRPFFDPDEHEFCSEEVKNSLYEMGIVFQDTSIN